MKRVLRYLKGIINNGLYYTPSFLDIHTYCDSELADNPDDRRSTSGYGVFLGRNLMSWSSKKQYVVSRSSTEAEYHSMALATAKLYWIQMLFKELGIGISSTPTLWCDNISAIALSSNPVFHARTKHVEIDYHFIREKVCHRGVKVQYISTLDQVADIFTKGQFAQQFQVLKHKLMVCSRPINLKGGVRSSDALGERQQHDVQQPDMQQQYLGGYVVAIDCNIHSFSNLTKSPNIVPSL